MTEALPPCTYRRARLGYLVCTIASRDGSEHATDMTSVAICQACPVPEILGQVGCVNLSVGKKHWYHQFMGGASLEDDDSNVAIDCEPVGFEVSQDYKSKCSATCPKFVAIHKDLSSEALLEVEKPKTDSTDRQLRQIVLMALYTYHARHPERYGRFDVTPDFLATNLGLNVTDVLRVVAPMEERGEVKTAQSAGDPHFQHVYITAKGIEHIDAEPLFNTADTARIRMENNISISNSQGVAVNTGDNSSVTSTFSAEARQTAADHLKNVRQAVEESDLTEDVKTEVLDRVAIVEEQAVKEIPDIGRVQRALNGVKTAIAEIPVLAGKTVLAVESVDKLFELFGGNLVG
jgi:DNA-binding MarR family transcriptional regulator